MLGPWIKANWKWSNRRCKHQHFSNQWTTMGWNGQLNSDDHYIYYCGQESTRRNRVSIIVNKSPKCTSEVTQLCLTLCNPMDFSLQGSSVHGIFHARVLEWVAISFSRESSQLRDWIPVSHIAGRRFTL